MILVAGGTGTIGTGVVRELLARGQAVRALVRTDGAAGVLREQRAEAVLGDVGDTDSLVDVLRGCDHAFFVLPGSPAQGALEEGFVEAAKAAGVAHVVKGSVLGAGADSDLSFGRWHATGEAALERSGMDWIEGMAGAGIPPAYADALIELMSFYRAGRAERVSTDIEAVLGRPARSYDDFARDHADEFR